MHTPAPAYSRRVAGPLSCATAATLSRSQTDIYQRCKVTLLFRSILTCFSAPQAELLKRPAADAAVLDEAFTESGNSQWAIVIIKVRQPLCT